MNVVIQRLATRTRPAIASWAARASVAVLVVSLSACGGGESATDHAQTTNSTTVPPEGRSTAMAASVASAVATTPGLISGVGWVAAPPALAAAATRISDTSAYTAVGKYNQDTGTAYYVSAQGNDGNSGTSPAQPWKTLWPVTEKKSDGSQRVTFKAQDAILLRCGDTWNQEMVLGRAGNPSLDNGILLAAYDCDGSRPRPLISGATALPVAGGAGWSAAGQTTQTIALTDRVKRLYVNGVPATPARYPNGLPGFNFARATVLEAVPGESTQQRDDRNRRFFRITGADLDKVNANSKPNGEHILGAKVHIRTTTYTTETAVIKGFDAGTGVVELETQPAKGNLPALAHPLAHPIMQDAGYVLSGKAWMVDAPGEWLQDDNKVLYYGASAAPAGVFTAAVQRKTSGGNDKPTIGLWLYQIDNLKVEHLALAYNDQNVDLSIGKNVVFRDVVSVYADETGISANFAPHIQVLDSRIEQSGLDGILLAEADNALVSGNAVYSTGMHRLGQRLGEGIVAAGKVQNVDSAAWHGFTGWGIRVRGAGTIVENNFVLDSANVGIAFSDRLGTYVRNNTVLHPCRLATDCGGIYTSNENWDTSNPQTITSHIQKNIVAGLVSNLDGAPKYGANLNLTAGENQANGIYLDDSSTTVEVSENLVVGAEVGIYLHNSAYNVIKKNVTRNISHASLLVSNDSKKGSDSQTSPAWVTRGNVITDNILFSRRTVDAAAFDQSPYRGVRGKSTYAQLWLNSSADAGVFFRDSASGVSDRNVSTGNTTLSLTKVAEPAVWRMESPDRTRSAPLEPVLEQVSGAVWGTRSFNDPFVEMGRAAWLTLAGSASGVPDAESSPVSYLPYKVTNPGTELLRNPTFDNWWLIPTWTPSEGTRRFLPNPLLYAEKCPAPLSTCAKYTATGANDRLTSNPFALTAEVLYSLGYTVQAGANSLRHSAHVGEAGADAQVVMRVTPEIELKGVSAEANAEARRIETFVRPTTGMDKATLSLRGGDGTSTWFNKPVYFANATVKSVAAVSVLPKLADLGVTVINAMAAQRTFSCAELGYSNSACASELLASDGADVTEVRVPAMNASQYHLKLPNWLVTP